MVENGRDVGELEELETLLDEIPHATSRIPVHLYHRHRYVRGDGDDHGSFVTKQANRGSNNGMCYDDDPSTQIKFSCASSTVSGFSLQTNGSSSSLFSGGHSLSDTGSPTPPPLEELKSTMPCGSSFHPNTFWLDSNMPDSTVTVRENAGGTLVDELGLCANLSKMYIGNQHENPNGLPYRGNNPINVHNNHGGYDNFMRGSFDSVGFQSPFLRSPISRGAEMDSALIGLTQGYNRANLLGSLPCPGWHDTIHSQLNGFSGSMDSPRHGRQLINNHYCRGNLAPELVASLSRNPAPDASIYAPIYGLNLMEERGMSRLPNYPPCTNFSPHMSVQDLEQYNLPLPNARAVPPSNARIPQGNLDAITSEGSFIIQGEGLNYVVNKGSDSSMCHRAMRETTFAKHPQRLGLDNRHRVVGICENPRSLRIGCSFPLLSKCNSLAEARGCIYFIAKDQHGCRFLQRMFDEGTPGDVQVIFNEIINHVVELMMNPFGNYLMQKLLDVCNEEQRMQIIRMVTEEPGQLVKISLNTHGTRVVQKLIETLKTRQQISLVVSALEPGFLALIKDLNGNHVVQHCLQCLSNEDNKFIFVAAAKYCVDIATHQHGCCVLQRCIGHSSGEHREKLVAEISANALLLAQDQFGNYVVQFILDLRIPSAIATLSWQFKGNYVHLSMQKFGSHVVEKCLAVFNVENQSRVIDELLSAPRFEQLLQDPHANYVVQSALRLSEGRVHNLLVEAIESRKGISRNCPYSKNIFSQKLSKK
ncbi:putative pumilio homolog 7, chloroplastic [Gastrolobium bilobum]|uniref:putative pumilio homolog 7, chloroplastic n=1 Tax=Gastrolobium bilobum TaxID=150636 RepID=UPI002AB18FD0|nr:putative pumilio homolog 7, chloroplastic [Gastrolobium bilobum]